MAYDASVLPVAVEATEDKSLGALLAAPLKKVLFELDRIKGAKDRVKKGIVALRNFIGTIHIDIGDIGLGIEPQIGFADSGDFEFDLTELFTCVAEAAAEKDKGIVVIVDEIQYLPANELGALIMAMHRMQQDSLPLALVGAGLPILPGLAGNAKTYAERLFRFPEIGALSPEQSAAAIREPFKCSNVCVKDDALEKIYDIAYGYPYFLQECGYQLWNSVDADCIEAADVGAVHGMVIERLDQNFFKVRMERLTNAERDFLYAMADIESGKIRIGDVANYMKVSVGALGPRRSALIKKGMIFSPCHGEIAFSVPLFGDYLKRRRR